MRWLTNFHDFRFKWTATAAIGIHPTKAWLSQLVNFKNVIWTSGHFRRMICNKNFVLNLEKMTQKRMECFRLLFDHLALIEHEFLSGIRDSRKADSVRDDERCGRSKEVNTPQLIGQTVMVRVTMLGFKGVQQEIPSEEASTLQIRSVAFPPGQCTSPHHHPCHRLFEQDGHQDSSSASL